MAGRTSLTLYEGMIGMRENVFINIKNRSHSITAEVEIPEGGANGVILAQGGRFGGWSLYFKDGKPTYTYNFLGLERIHSRRPPNALPPGKATIRMDFAYDGGGVGKGGTATILVNGKKVAERPHRTNTGDDLLGRRDGGRRHGRRHAGHRATTRNTTTPSRAGSSKSPSTSSPGAERQGREELKKEAEAAAESID